MRRSGFGTHNAPHPEQAKRVEGRPIVSRNPDGYFYERQIKGWSRAKKEALIKGDFELLHLLSQQYATPIQS
ncbi:MAG TPA: hypothetical protein VJN67_06080 [Stellaceae bacterium]|nr:hypothetical protein [Stellaceae bacterium]